MKNLKQKELTKKITAYSAVAGAVIAITPAADANIQYFDIVPDETFNTDGSIYNLDLNNDGVVDFKICLMKSYGTGYTTFGVFIQPMGNNFVKANHIAYGWLSSDNEALALNPNVPIQDGPNWIEGGYGMILGAYYNSYGSIYNSGPWLGVYDKYLGLCVKVSGEAYFGWARLDVGNIAQSFTIKDYAYEDVPNEQILAGQTSGINSIDISKNVSVYSFGNKIFVNTKDLKISKGTINVTNALGKVINTTAIHNYQTVISLDKIKTGLYFVRIEMSKGITTKKVFIERE